MAERLETIESLVDMVEIPAHLEGEPLSRRLHHIVTTHPGAI